MGWRPGEIWFDTDVLWFREQAGGQGASLALRAPALLGLPPAALPAFPNGLAASRARRAELRRRRNAKKTRAAALVLGPAVALTLAAPRLGGSAGRRWPARGRPAQPDLPPGARRSRGVGASGAGARRGVPPRARRASRLPRRPPPADNGGGHRPGDPLAPGDVARPPLRRLPHGRHPASGRRAGLGDLEPGGGRVPDEPRRLYGNEHTIRTVVSVLAAHRAANPDAPARGRRRHQLPRAAGRWRSTASTRTASTSTSTTRGSTACCAHPRDRTDRPQARPGSPRPLRRRRREWSSSATPPAPRAGRRGRPYPNHGNHCRPLPSTAGLRRLSRSIARPYRRLCQSTSTFAKTCHASRLFATRLSQRYQRSP